MRISSSILVATSLRATCLQVHYKRSWPRAAPLFANRLVETFLAGARLCTPACRCLLKKRDEAFCADVEGAARSNQQDPVQSVSAAEGAVAPAQCDLQAEPVGLRGNA